MVGGPDGYLQDPLIGGVAPNQTILQQEFAMDPQQQVGWLGLGGGRSEIKNAKFKGRVRA